MISTTTSRVEQNADTVINEQIGQNMIHDTASVVRRDAIDSWIEELDE